MSVKQECPCNGHFFLKSVTLILTLTDDLDFGTKERVLPQTLFIYVKYESSITYPLKAMPHVKVFADKQTDMPKTICS